jgi:tetratricopeptide (TPR) repeat protein
MGHIYLRAAKWNEARKAFEQAHQRFLVSPRIATSRALVEFQAGEFQLAVTHLRKALEFDPNYAPALYNMAFLYSHNQQQKAEAVKFFRRYLQAVDKADLAADDPHVKAARTFLELGTLTRPPPPKAPRPEPPPAPEKPVATAPTPAAPPPPVPAEPVSAAPRSPAPAPAPAPAETPAAKPEPAVKTSASALVVSARTALRREDYEGALVLLKEAVEKDPRNADALWELAQLYQKLPDHAEQANKALALFKARFPQDPRLSAPPAAPARPGPSSSTTAAAAQKANTVEAMKIWGKGLELQRVQNWDGAIAYYKKALQVDPNLYTAWYNMGLAYKSKNELPAARDAFSRTLELKPDLVGASFMLAVVYSDSKEKEKALQQLKKTLQMDPDYALAHFLAGMIYRDSGQTKLARKHLERYLQLAPNDSHAPDARKWLAALPAR